MIGFKKNIYTEPKNLLNQYLPWAYLYKENVIVQKDALLQRSFVFRGPDLQSSSAASLNSLCMQFNETVKRLGCRWAVSLEAQRYETYTYPEVKITNQAALLIDQERQQRFMQSGKHFDSSYYITFTHAPENDLTNRMLYKSKTTQNHSCKEEIENFINTTDDLAGILASQLKIRVLTQQETLSYLHTALSFDWHMINPPESFCLLDQILPDQQVSTGNFLKVGEYYLAIIAIHDFPMATYPGIMDGLNYCDLEYRWCNRFLALDKEDALKQLDNYAKMYHGKRKDWKQFMAENFSQTTSDRMNPGAFSAEQDVTEAMVELSDDLVGFGYSTTNLMVWDKDLQNTIAKMNTAKKIIQRRGFTCKQETINAFQAWLGMMPGNVYANVRRPIISTGNLAHIIPLTAVWSGEQFNTFTGKITGEKAATVICSTNTYTPFNLNINVDDVGLTFVSGPTGSGKSTALGLLAIQFTKYPDARVIIFDVDKSSRQLTLSVGGKYFEPGTARIAFQPLRDLGSAGGYLFAVEFITLLLQLQQIQITPEIQKAITTALDDMQAFPIEKLTISTFIQSVQHAVVKDALYAYSLQGHYKFFDSAYDTDLNHPWIMFEMAELMRLGEKAVTPALFYLFYAVEKLFTGKLTLLVLDEAWLFLAHDFFRERLRNWLKTLRKKNVFVVFATQEVADAASSPIMSTILQACHTKIYLADNEALTPGMKSIYSSFGLTDAEISTIAGMTKKQDYFYKSPLGSRLFRLDLGPVALALITGQNHSTLDRIEQDFPPEEYLKQILISKNMQHCLQDINLN